MSLDEIRMDVQYAGGPGQGHGGDLHELSAQVPGVAGGRGGVGGEGAGDLADLLDENRRPVHIKHGRVVGGDPEVILD